MRWDWERLRATTSGLNLQDEVAYEYEGKRFTATNDACERRRGVFDDEYHDEVGDVRTIWVGDDGEFVSDTSPKATRLGIVGVVVLVAFAMVMATRRVRRRHRSRDAAEGGSTRT